MKKRCLKTILMAILSIFAITAQAETYTGTCGDNLNWSLDTETGLLKITGEGDMSSNPWSSYKHLIKSVEIGNGVTSIGEDAFYNCDELTSVTIPNSVTSIGYYAFYDCYNIAEIYSLSSSPATILDEYSSFAIDSYTPIYVPKGSKTAYQNAIGWSKFYNIIELAAGADLEGEKIIINSSDNSSKEYGVGNIVNIKFSADDNLILSTLNAKEKYSLSEISSITAESEDNSSLVLNSYYGNTTEFDLSEIAEIEFDYAIPQINTIPIDIDIEQIMVAPNGVASFDVVVKEEYSDADIYPFLVEILKDGEPTTDFNVECENFQYGYGYRISLTAGSQKGEYTCRVVLGSYVKDIPVSVDYGVYLSHNMIDPDYLNNVGLLTYKTISLGETVSYSFFCYLDGASDAKKAEVREMLLNKENYVIDGLTLEIGDITIDDYEDVWVVNVPLVSKAKTYENGIVALTIEDKTIKLNLTLDDGKHFNELYISFVEIYTYSEETKLYSRKLDENYVFYIGGEEPTEEKERFKIIVYYTMAPDDRGDYINWNVTMPQGANAPVKYIGMKKLNTRQFEFEFELQAAGDANIGISIENPKADDPNLTESEKELYEQYRYQTLTALVNVINRQDVDVESIVFVDSEDLLTAEIIEEMVVSSKSTPLYSYILPEESAGAWPAVYSIECFDGAEATVKQASVDEKTGVEIPATLEVTHAGTIVVTATSKDRTAQLLVDAKLRINKTAEGKKLELYSKKDSYGVGETEKLGVKLKSDFKVYDYEYTWTSSNPDVVTVDAYGNITAVSDGTATITASITDDYGYTATASIDLTARTVNASVNFDAPEYAEHLVIKLPDEGEPGKYYIDTEEPSELDYFLQLKEDIVENGVYTVGTDITGTIDFPSGDRFNLIEGTITISDEGWTFDLQISNGVASGTVTGTKPYVEF